MDYESIEETLDNQAINELIAIFENQSTNHPKDNF